MVAPQRCLPALIATLLAAMTLGGCLGADTGDLEPGEGDALQDPTTAQNGTTDRVSVEGFVRDISRQPLPGTKVILQNHGREATTDKEGHYAFTGLVDNELYVLIADADGHEKKAQQIVAIDDKVVRLDFILEKEPEEKSWDQVLERAGLISCQAFAGAGHDHGGDGTELEQSCRGIIGQAGLEDPSANQVLEFSIEPKAAGVVVELQWDSSHDLADVMMMTVETVGYGDLDKTFGSIIAPSVIKMEIPQEDVAKYYAGQGGNLRVTVDVHFEDDDEETAGVAAAYQQAFLVRVSNFYVTPQPQGYTAFPEGAA